MRKRSTNHHVRRENTDAFSRGEMGGGRNRISRSSTSGSLSSHTGRDWKGFAPATSIATSPLGDAMRMALPSLPSFSGTAHVCIILVHVLVLQ